MPIHIGFTGTQHGMTDRQKQSVSEALQSFSDVALPQFDS